jgi:hypothetical protein
MNLGCRHCTRPSSACDCPASVQRAEPIVALRDAEATIRATAAETRMRLARQIFDNDRWSHLVDLAVERATSIGAQQYGDASYNKTDAELEAEGDDEIADWLFYAGVIEERTT